MADGSPGDRVSSKLLNDLTFSAPDKELCDTKKWSDETFDSDSVKLSFYKEQVASESCEKSGTRSVADESAAIAKADLRNSFDVNVDSEDRKKRCFDRYDSSESSDSGVAVLSPTESGGCSGSDITEPRSPRSPESACSTGEESAVAGASTRMPPWASEPAPPAPRRLAVQPAPVRRPNPPAHRRITEFFNHKMKPQNGLKKDSNSTTNEDSKKKCLPKNGVTHDLEKYISYLSQTLCPKVLMDVGKQTDALRKPVLPPPNGVVEQSTVTDFSKYTLTPNVTNSNDFSRPKDNSEKLHNTTMNGFVEVRRGPETVPKEKQSCVPINGVMNGKRQRLDTKFPLNPSTNANLTIHRVDTEIIKRKIPIPASTDTVGMRIGPATSISQSPKKSSPVKPDTTKFNKTNGVVSSTTMLDSRMNGVTYGSNNLILNPLTSKLSPAKKEPWKKVSPIKRTNRKSSACIANSKNMTWSKANNLKLAQQQQQQQNCVSSNQNQSLKSNLNNMNTPSKPVVQNGIRQMSMTINGNISTLNVPVTNLQNCHQINIPQPCNGTVTSNNLPSFVAVPQNVMLTTLRIPHNGLQASTLGHQNNITTFNRPNVNVSSPTKLSGQFVFPLMQNINGTVVQIPNLMAKMPNFVLPQAPQLTAQRQQDHSITNQHAAQILINGTLLKLANAVSSTYPNVNKPGPVTSQSIPVINKNVTGIQAVGMTVQPKPNFAVNLSHPLLVPQPGFIVTSVPNINVKETWSYTSSSTVSSSQSVCSNPLVNHPSSSYDRVTNFTTHTLHTSSIPIAPVKPPDNPIQGTDPPSSTVKEPETNDSNKLNCDIPWLSKTVNNNIVPLEMIKMSTRPFESVSNVSEKLKDFTTENTSMDIDKKFRSKMTNESNSNELRKVEEVARREETIFTQITVLKDVSSNVHSTVIESNFCSPTTESESGIGTDKSIDSPSDSQMSKECDEDSSLSLSVSLCSVDVQSQKSPILKQPKTLRFPPKSSLKTNNDRRKTSTDTTTVVTCLWENCKKEFESDPELLDHLQAAHVETQAGKENYVCLWERCKVRGKPSCSRLWLERHTLSHGSNKPFKCIVDNCERRFSTQTLLERHVNHHFNESSSSGSGTKKASESGSKLIRRNGKKLRYRRQPWSARMFDYFDASTMEGLAWRLLRCTRWRLGGASPLREPPGQHTLTLHAVLTATRYNTADRITEALVTYYPPHVLDDEWVPVKEVKRIKRVEIVQLPVATKVVLYEQFCASYRKYPSQPVKRLLGSSSADPNRMQSLRNCASSRVLNNLLAKQKKTADVKNGSGSRSTAVANYSMVYKEEEKADRVEVSGAKKRKLGRRYGGNVFWPCGR